MKKIYNLLKRVVLSLCLLYSFNLIMVNTGIIIPINISSITMVTFLGGPGLIGLVVLYKMI